MHYRDITAAAFNQGLWSPRGGTPANTLNRDVSRDIGRSQGLGIPSVFVRDGGFISLNRVEPLVAQEGHRGRAGIKRALIEQAMALHPQQFEVLAAELVRRLGFDNVALTRYSRDGGIDFRATFDCAGLTRLQHVFQVKRTRRPVGEPCLREFCGAVADDQGVFLTTSGLLPGAKRLAGAWRRPIVVVERDQLAELLIETGLGAARTRVEILEPQPFSQSLRRLTAV